MIAYFIIMAGLFSKFRLSIQEGGIPVAARMVKFGNLRFSSMPFVALVVWLGNFCTLAAQQVQDPVSELRELLRAQQARLEELEKQLQLQKNPNPTNDPAKSNEVSTVAPQRNDKSLPELSQPLGPKNDPVEEKTSENFIAPPPPRPVKDDGMFAVWGKDGRLTFKNEDGSTVSRLGGLFQYDSGWYIVSDNTNSLLNRPLEQGSNLRRARLRSDGVCYDNLEWVFEFDLSRAADNNRNANTNSQPDPNVMFNNVFFGVRDIPFFGVVRVGHIKEELSFYSASSGRNIPFMERPAAWDAIEDPYLFDNGITISNTYFDDFLYVWMGFFQTNTRTGAFTINPEGSYAFDLRTCLMPIYEDDGKDWLNIGATGSFRANPNGVANDRPTVQASNLQPQIRTGSSIQVPSLINPGNISTQDGTQLFTVCLNRGYGPWSFGCQYDGQYVGNAYFEQKISVENSKGDSAYSFNYKQQIGNIYYQGASFEVLRFLTKGDHRGVNKRDPSFLQVIPQHNLSFGTNGREKGIGAWEVGFKYDFAQLEYYLPGNMPEQDSLVYKAMREAAALPGSRGGNLSAFTLGLNWYLNPNALVMANYVYTTGTFNEKSSQSLAPFDSGFHSFGTRFQFVF
jgi:phosphate-selective porin OprO/OprP